MNFMLPTITNSIAKDNFVCVLCTLVTEYIVGAPNIIILSSSQYCTNNNWQTDY